IAGFRGNAPGGAVERGAVGEVGNAVGVAVHAETAVGNQGVEGKVRDAADGDVVHLPAGSADGGVRPDPVAQADTLACVDGAQVDGDGSEGRVPRADPHESRSPLQRVPAAGSDAAGIAWRSGTPHVGPGGAAVVADLDGAPIDT